MVYNVYTDGSYKNVPGIGELFSSAATIQSEKDSKPTVLTKVSDDKEYISMHNVAGEILAVIMAMEHCMNVLHVTQEDTVVIHHDYVGIHNWLKKKGEKDFWRATKLTTQAYREYMNGLVKTRCNLKFVHTPGHSGIAGNERVDAIAREAMQNHINRLRQVREE